MNKIIAKEVPYERQDFSHYFDDDGLKGDYACYIPERTHTRGFNAKEYAEIQEQAERIIDGFDDVLNRWTNGYNSYDTYKECIEFNGITYTSRKCHLLKKWAKDADYRNTDDIAEFLTIITGDKWYARGFCGYSQGDFCEVVYPEKHYSKDSITAIGKMWLGCGSEFSINDGELECYGFYVIDTIRWQEGEVLRKELADQYGCKPEELEVQLYKGDRKEPIYEVMEVA